jgi:hypothetical protein
MSARRKKTLAQRFPPSPPCTCAVCLGYCRRPGWWTLSEAARAIEAGYAGRMMLEMAQDGCFGVLAPAFKGCEVNFALDLYAARGCTFLVEERCELFSSGLQPLECRFCHHTRPNQGLKCHLAIAREWDSPAGRQLVVAWSRQTGFWQRKVSHLPQE